MTIGDASLPDQEGDVPSSSAPQPKGILPGGAAQAIHQVLVEQFNNDELITVSFEMGIDYENHAGEGKVGKARALVENVQRENRLSELTQLIQNVRPQANLGDWEESA